MDKEEFRKRDQALQKLVRNLGKSMRPARNPIPKDNNTRVDVTEENDEVGGAQESSVNTALEIARISGLSEKEAEQVLKSPLESLRQFKVGATVSEEIADENVLCGRFELRDRYNVDQVPFSIIEGDGRTYESKGQNYVWIAGSGKYDETKRFCTLQICVRGVNGDKTELYAGQPPPEICFRGRGLRISEAERSSWNKNVYVRFQPNAWYDAVTCENWANEILSKVTSHAKHQRESLLLMDNLYGQTTTEFRDICRKKANTIVHLLPAGVTDMIQLIDAGFGKHVKTHCSEYHSGWLQDTENHKKWVNGMSASQLRVYVTNLVACAYDRACKSWDFAHNATKVGMNMTVGSEPYSGVNIQGLGPIFFTDDDGGPLAEDEADGSDDDKEEDGIDDHDLPVEQIDETMEEAEKHDSENNDECSIADEEGFDDTDPEAFNAVFAVGPPKAPPGYQLNTDPLDHENAVIGKNVLILLASQPLEENEFGWYVGQVARREQAHSSFFFLRFSSNILCNRYSKKEDTSTKKRKFIEIKSLYPQMNVVLHGAFSSVIKRVAPMILNDNETWIPP